MATYTDNYNLTKPTFAESADIRTINGNMDTIDDIMHASQVSLADAYDSTKTYNKDDVVMYQYLMYKCKEDNVTGSWDATKWERTTAGENGAGGTEVEANPSGTPSADLAKLGINGIIYGIPSGDEVEANPSGTGDTDLTKLGINGTIYNIPSGGGGDSNYTEVSLFTGTSRVTNMTLSESIKNFDAIEFQIAWMYNDLPYHISEIITSKNLSANNYFVIGSNNYRYAELLIIDNTHINWTDGSDNIMYVKEIKGIKYGSGGGRNSEIIPISAGDGTTSRTFTFEKTPKFIKVYWEDSIDGGWTLDAEIAWGQPYVNYKAHSRAISITGLTGGLAQLTYGTDGKSVTVISGNAFGAWNTANGSGFMFVDYGEGGSGGGDAKSKFLPFTNKIDMCCEATMDNFDSSSLSWGDGETPIALTAQVSTQDGGVLIPVYTSGIFASINRECKGRPFTAYIVAKAINAGQYSRILSALVDRNTNTGIMIVGNPIQISAWSNDTVTSIASNTFFVGVLQYTSPGAGFGLINNVSRIWKPINNTGNYITIGRTDPNPTGDYEEPCDVVVKYLGVVDKAESLETVNKNVASLMTKFGIS